MVKHMDISPKVQEYLAEAYRLAQQGGATVSTSDLAEQMDVSAPAAARMISRLSESGLVEHEPYRGIRLTPAGEREALKSIRRHRLVEAFLVNVMAFGWDEVHDEADAIGAVVSDVVADRMEALAGYPTRCPHGEPIPTAEGVMPEVHDVLMTEVHAPADLIVSRVRTHDAEKLRYLADLRLIPDQPVTLVSRAPFHGPLRLTIDGHEQVIGYELARVLRVALAE
ncbi:MAG: metal-dependent transcriptional regulator [Anaerolineae bacterium]